MEVLPLTGGAGRRPTCCGSGCPPAATCLLARPGPLGARRAGDVLRRAARMAAGPAALALRYRSGAGPDRASRSDGEGWSGRSIRRSWPHRRRAAMTQTVADTFADWHRRASGRLAHAAAHLARPDLATGRPARREARPGCGATRRTGPGRGGEPPDEGGPGLPVLLGRPRRGAGARPRPGRDADRLGHEVAVLAPADDPATLPAFLVAAGPGDADPVQRLGRPALVRSGVLHPGPPLDPGRRTSTSCTCTSRSRRACPCSPDGRRRADRRHLPHREPPLPDADRVPGGAAAVPGEDHRPDRGQRLAARRSGGAPRRGCGDHPQRRRRAVLRRCRGRCPGTAGPAAPIGFVGRYDEPRKGMSVLLDALRLLVPTRSRTCGCWWPAAATRRSCGRTPGRSWRPAVRLLGRVSDADKAAMLRAVTSTARRTSAGRASASSSSRRWRRHPGGGQRPGRVPAGARGRQGRRAGAGRRRGGAGQCPVAGAGRPRAAPVLAADRPRDGRAVRLVDGHRADRRGLRDRHRGRHRACRRRRPRRRRVRRRPGRRC